MSRFYLIFVVCFLFVTGVDAQTYRWVQQDTGVATLNSAAINTVFVDQAGNVYVAGQFADGMSFDCDVAKWNGSSWTMLGAPFNSAVYTLTEDANGNIYAAGGFTDAAGNIEVAKWDGTSWSEVGNGVAATANFIAAITIDPAGNIYAAGALPDNSNYRYVAKWDGNSWSELGVGPNALRANSNIACLAADAAGNIYAAGQFTDGQNNTLGTCYVAKWNGTSWSEAGISSNALNANSSISCLIVEPSGDIYASGSFTDGASFQDGQRYLAKWNGNSWSEMGGGGNDEFAFNQNIKSMTQDASGNIYVAGQFTDAMGYEFVAEWNGSAWSEVGAGIDSLYANDQILATAIDQAGNLYAGGYFSNSSGATYVAEANILQPCTGTPAVGIINEPTTCANQSFAISPYLSAGLTYQWQQSANGAGFTPITGATNASYATTYPIGTVYLNCVVTCASSSASSTSNTDTVTTTFTQSYASLPYSQDFENTWASDCGSSDNDIPDANWVNSEPQPLSAINPGWRRSDYGTFDANFSPYPSGSHSAVFHTVGTPDPNFGISSTDNLDLYLDCSNDIKERMTFYYTNLAADAGDSMSVYLSTNGASGPFVRIGGYDTASNWTLEAITFFSSSPTTVIRFTGMSVFQYNDTGNIGLDDLNIINLPACTGTPVAGTVSPSNAILYSCDTMQTAVLQGSPDLADITYQWQQSSDGINFAPITGATDTSYTGSFSANAVTYLNCVVSCTASNQAATSNMDTIGFSPQQYFAVTSSNSYFQGFEGQWPSSCDIDNIPDLYWLNTPTTGNDSWRQSGDGASAGWQNPDGYLYAPLGSDANGASSSNSATFHSSFVFLAYGTLDLCVNLAASGTKKIAYDYINVDGSDGMTVLISTNGPAGPFTAIDTIGTSANWVTRTILTNATTNNCIIRFRGNGDNGASDIGLDNVKVSVLPSCTGVPTDHTITAPNTCSIQSFAISADSVSDITYQWQQSTDGINYTPVSGATNVNYSGVFQSGIVNYLNCVVTCTASNSPVTSNTDTIVVDQPYAALPYTQGFDSTWINTCSSTDNDVPDTFWANTDPQPLSLFNVGWRRSDYASFYDDLSPYPSGSYSAVFHTNYTAADTGISKSSDLDLFVDCSNAGSDSLIFYYNNMGGSDSLTVYVSSNGIMGPFTKLGSYVSNSGWTYEVLPFSSSSSKTVIRFTGTSVFADNGGSDIGLDSVNIKGVPTSSAIPTVLPGLESINLYPDPNTGDFIVTGMLNTIDTKTISFTITNVLGQTIYKANEVINNGGWTKQFSLKDKMASGLYLLHVGIEGQMETIKIIVDR